jgi:hypothetical protein
MSVLLTIRETICKIAWPVRILTFLLLTSVVITTQVSSMNNLTDRFAVTRGRVVQIARESDGVYGGYRSPIRMRHKTTMRILFDVNGERFEFVSPATSEDLYAIHHGTVEIYYDKKNPYRAYLMPPQTEYGSLIITVVPGWILYELVRIGLHRSHLFIGHVASGWRRVMLTHATVRLPCCAVVLAALGLLTACEEDGGGATRHAGAEPTASQRPSLPAATNSLGRESNNALGRQEAVQENDPHVFWREIIEGAGSTDTNWVFPPPPVTVDANSFLDENGNYVVDGLVFTNCDDLGFYLISLEPVGTIWVTNCGRLSLEDERAAKKQQDKREDARAPENEDDPPSSRDAGLRRTGKTGGPAGTGVKTNRAAIAAVVA